MDNRDVARDGLGRVAREAQNVSGIDHRTDAMPGLCNRAVLRDVVLSLARFLERVRIDALEPEENPINPGTPAFLNEPPDLVGNGIDLNRKSNR